MRKQRPFYYASEDQFRWLQAIAQKINPKADLNDVEQLKDIAQSLDSEESVIRERGFQNNSVQIGTKDTIENAVNIQRQERTEEDADCVGTLKLDPRGHPSTFEVLLV